MHTLFLFLAKAFIDELEIAFLKRNGWYSDENFSTDAKVVVYYIAIPGFTLFGICVMIGIIDLCCDCVCKEKYNRSQFLFTKSGKNFIRRDMLLPKALYRQKFLRAYPARDIMRAVSAQALSPYSCTVGTERLPHMKLSLPDGEFAILEIIM